MATLTNKHGLPQALVRYLERDPYTRGSGVRFSVTQLIDSPQIRVLRKAHDEEMERDVSEMVWLILGKAVHTFLDDAAAKAGDPDVTVEERVYLPVDGRLISGAMDTQEQEDGGTWINDWKVTSAFSVVYGKEAWVNQLNGYAHLLRAAKGKRVTRLTITAILRDWRAKDAAKNPDYPQQAVVVIEIPVWDPEVAADYIRERVRMHADTDTALAWGDELPSCSNEERWMRDNGWWKVERRARTGPNAGSFYTAKSTPSEEEAREYMATNKGEMKLVKPVPTPIRCIENYCGVAQWCQQWARERPPEKEA
jgi:hypothetical protein